MPSTRRHWLKRTITASCAAAVSVRAGTEEKQHEPSEAETHAIGEIATEVMGHFHVPGLSVAFARHGQLVFRAAYGFADPASGEKASPAHRWRVASMSKPITATAIFLLIEQERLALTDRVFGIGGLLKFQAAEAARELVEKVTIHHLLTHTGGGWANDRNDPMFQHPEMDHAQLIEWTLQHQPLTDAPGSKYAYSNFGYCLLGRVIESLTGQGYADYVKSRLLQKCGVRAMEIGGNTRGERAAHEVVYLRESGGNPYGMNVRRMDAHGGWIATPADYVQFLTHVDGLAATRNLLKPETIKTMTTPSAANAHYACGWAVNAVPNWWHAGSLPGSATIGVRTASGLCWAAFTNRREEGLGPALDEMMWRMARAVPQWRA